MELKTFLKPCLLIDILFDYNPEKEINTVAP